MNETLRGGANAIYYMLATLMLVATSEKERERMIEFIENTRQELADQQGTDQAREQFDKLIDSYLNILKSPTNPA